jgi:peptide/nickel transport system substrate-binding protein
MSSNIIQRGVMAALAGMGALALAACSGGSTSAGSAVGAGKGGTLTIAVSGDSRTLDPASCQPLTVCEPAYEGLVQISPKTGDLVPGLATAWQWVGDTHEVLQLTLRAGAKFDDGTPLDGADAAASINSYLTAGGPFASVTYPIKTAKAAGADKVEIYYSVPVTQEYALYQLAGQSGVGLLVGPKSAANRSRLTGATDGIGPYKLDVAQTTKSVQYVYVPNPDYYDQGAIEYSKVILKPVQDPQARLSDILSGQVNWASDLPTTDLAAVKGSKLTISRGALGQGSFPLLAFMKRGSGPLADVRVRQALAYAVPRAQIASALFGSTAKATGSVIPAGSEGYNAADTGLYGYNAAKAKQLLAQAGYASGLSISVLDASFFDPGSVLGQALKSALAKVGVTLNLVASNATPGNVAQLLATGKYDAAVLSTGGYGLSAAIYTMFKPGAFANPLGVPLDKQLTTLMQAAASAPVAQQGQKDQAATARLDELVYAVPIATVPSLQAVSTNISNVPQEFWTTEMNPFSPGAGEAWQTTG